MSLSGLGELFDFGSKILDKFIPDPQAKAAAQIELFKLQQNGELANLAAETTIASKQSDTNIAEANTGSLYLAGWRPAVGWACALAFASKFVGGPLLYVISQYFNHPIILPEMDMSEMLPLLFGMLGLGTLRTVEKIKKVV